MNTQDTEKMLNQIVSGIVYFRYCGQYYTARPLTVEDRQQCDCYYDSLIEEFKYKGLIKERDLLNQYFRRKILEPDYEAIIKKNSKKIDDLKIQLFRTGPRITVAKQVRRSLSALREVQNEYLDYVGNLKKYSLEGFATVCKKQLAFAMSIYDSDGKKIFDGKMPNYQMLNSILYRYIKTFKNEKDIRAFVRSSDWRKVWGSKKYDAIYTDVVNLNDEQRAAVHFSEFYDFVYQHEDCPKDAVMDDDDMIDGWYLNLIKEHDRKKRESDSGVQKDGQTEIFIMARDQEEADEIYASNDDAAIEVLRQRAVAIKTHGVVKASEMPDIKQEMALESNRQFMQKVKG